MNQHQPAIGASSGSSTDHTVSPPTYSLNPRDSVSNVEVYPNEVYSGGVSQEGPVEDTEEEVFEEHTPPAGPVPPRVSHMEKERHYMQGHVMYRSWCPHCVRIGGRANPHSSSDPSNERAYPILH